MFHNFFWTGMWGGWIFWILIIILIIWAVTNSSRNNYTRNYETPEDILKKRYAKGEITKEQFEQMKKDIH